MTKASPILSWTPTTLHAGNDVEKDVATFNFSDLTLAIRIPSSISRAHFSMPTVVTSYLDRTLSTDQWLFDSVLRSEDVGFQLLQRW